MVDVIASSSIYLSLPSSQTHNNQMKWGDMRKERELFMSESGLFPRSHPECGRVVVKLWSLCGRESLFCFFLLFEDSDFTGTVHLISFFLHLHTAGSFAELCCLFSCWCNIGRRRCCMLTEYFVLTLFYRPPKPKCIQSCKSAPWDYKYLVLNSELRWDSNPTKCCQLLGFFLLGYRSYG